MSRCALETLLLCPALAALLGSLAYQVMHQVSVVPLVTGAGRSGTHTIANWIKEVAGIPALHEGSGTGAVSVSWFYGATVANHSAFGDIHIPEFRFLKGPPFLLRAFVDPSRLKIYLEEPFGIGLTQVEGAPRSSVLANVRFAPVVRVVREPLASISSIARCFCGSGSLSFDPYDPTADRLSFAFAETQLGYLGATRVERAANYWLRWHRLLDRVSIATLRVEEMDGTELLLALGILPFARPLRLPFHMYQRSHRSVIPDQERTTLSWDELRRHVGAELAMQVLGQALAYGYAYNETFTEST